MQNNISYDEIIVIEKQKREHFANSLGGFKSVSLIGKADNLSNENVAIFSSIFHIGGTPPLIALLFGLSHP
jgi:hypothetical protein